MKIKQILNNNVAIVRKANSEVIVVSRGIGFKYKKDETISSSEVEKVYILDSYDLLEHFSSILSQCNTDDIILVNDIVAYAEAQLEIKISDYLYLTLLDHLDFLFKRVDKGHFLKSPLYWNIKRLYPKHYTIGLNALKIIEKRKNIQLPED